ncbi:MAG: rhamnulokinase [Anaerolineae bacterium]|jgi:rhamnulokinase
MGATSNYLAFDLGAESGRAIAATFDGAKIGLETIHRFPNGPIAVFDNLYWDTPRLYAEMRQGMRIYAQERGKDLDGIGLDTWGVDYALLDHDGRLLSLPYNYRDPRTAGMYEAVFSRVPRAEVFAQTGIQFMEINTLYQLYAMRMAGDRVLDLAETFLMIPDLFNYWFTGVKRCEFSDATTTQFWDPRRGTWATDLLARLSLPTHIFAPVVQPGTIIGELYSGIAQETGLDGVPVIAPACHDTGSAVAAVPATGGDFAYISSGTWSLMGIETTEPIITDDSLRYNFTNEGGVCGTYRFLKNIMGLWLVQQCRATWAQEGEALGYDVITQMAAEAPAFAALVDPDDEDFLRPGDMPSRIRAYCQRTGQTVPESKGAIVRCALESLALRYRWTLEKLELMLGRSLNRIHIVGGGIQNQLLCQFAADATQRQVVAGPVEATAAGNVLMQAMARGRVASLDEGREVIRNSFELATYEPGDAAPWDEAYDRWLGLLQA